MSNEPKMRRVTLVLRNDLNDRVIKRAEELGQNPNNFVNMCVEGMPRGDGCRRKVAMKFRSSGSTES